MTDVSWYARRLGRMSPGEAAWRVREQALRSAWTRRQVRPGEVRGDLGGLRVLDGRRFAARLPDGTAEAVPSAARAAVAADADRLLKGEWETLGVVRTDMDEPDWFADPVTGRRSASARYSFRVNHRSEAEVGNVKQVWEISRLQHLTLLACAYYLTGTEAYAARAASQLEGWWRANPFLSGVNWTSGIEVGIRLINFVWIRRLLSPWPGVSGLFEDSPLALRQLRWHQEYLAAFVSRGSSANNHVIAEAAGQLAASCAFPWFPDSARWRRASARLLARSLAANTFPSGINRELATDYHGFVFELGAFAAVESAAAGSPVDPDTWALLGAMADGMAALADASGRPPRQGDSDEGRVVLLDAPAPNRWPALLALGDALFGRSAWWPAVWPDAGSTLAGALAGGRREVHDRPPRRPSRFADAGITILRTAGGPAPRMPGGPGPIEPAPEIWCRCDGGPHGFGSLAAHAHADALSVEVRYGGVDVLADPGTYCYHGEPGWRSYFRSTIAHNTLEVAGRSQSAEGGPFLWTRHARAGEIPAGDPETAWTAEHDGYASLRPGITHRRSVRLDPAARSLEITDTAKGGEHDVRLAFHLGPDVTASLSGPAESLPGSASSRPGPAASLSGPAVSRSGPAAELAWPGGSARLDLPAGLSWTLHRGETEPPLGWYSEGLGRKVPATVLIGAGRCLSGVPLVTRLRFFDPEPRAETR